MTTARNNLSDAGRLYVAAVSAAGILIVLHSLYVMTSGPIGYQWFVLAGLTLLSGSFTVRIPTIPARLSVSETFVFAAALLFGPAAATVIVVLDSLIISLWLKRASRHISRVLFNMAAPSIAIWAATYAFFAFAQVPPLAVKPQPMLSLVAPLLLLALLYFLLNSWLIAGAVGFEKRISPFFVWRDNFLWLSLNYFSGASVAALLLPYLQSDRGALVRVASILLPILLISYLTFKTALGRVDDANRHLSELNRLYLSTIETLAMAIDAKDQITHGHIRRVQQYAIGLASHVGISDSTQIKAIEAASLLHDMGKLAVPEYILNKPGKLTAAEFEKMKLHASVGADILSAINFPYPVVPIVRHHHENWDGTGYPDGLSGSDIPIGARILSVVDCFDALTSDRPYRPRLSDSDAIDILLERRGTMYDPLIVDTFVSVHADLAPSTEEKEDVSPTLTAFNRDTPLQLPQTESDSGLEEISASTDEMLVLFDMARSLTASAGISDAAERVAKQLRRVLPPSTAVFYFYDPARDELVVSYANGEHSSLFHDLRIPRGQRLTGWVAANRQTILNSDPILDLGESARSARPRLRTCLSTPVIHEGTIVGVMSFYSAQKDGFSRDHKRIAEAVARQISPIFKQSQQQAGSSVASAYSEPGVRPSSYGEKGFGREDGLDEGVTIALVQLTARRADQIKPPSEDTMAAVAAVIRGSLRGADILFRYSSSELVVLFGHSAVEIATSVGRRIAELINDSNSVASHFDASALAVTIGTAATPADGITIDSLIAAARLKGQSLDDFTQRPTSIH